MTYCGSSKQLGTQFVDAVDVSAEHARGWASALLAAKALQPDSTSGGARMPIELKKTRIRLVLGPQDLHQTNTPIETLFVPRSSERGPYWGFHPTFEECRTLSHV